MLVFSTKAVLNRDLIVLFNHLEQCQSAGVPIFDSLKEACNLVDHRGLSRALDDIHDRVRLGRLMSEGMDDYPKLFSKILVNLIRTGERTGELTQSFQYCKDHVSWVENYRRQIKRILRYPIIVMVLFLILEWINGGVLIQMSALTGLGLFIAYKLLRAPGGKTREIGDTIVLKIPMIGKWVEQYSLAKFASSFAYLFESGQDMRSSLKYASQACDNYRLRLELENVSARVKTGQSLYQAFEANGRFPSMVMRMVKAGETSGNLSKVFHEISKVYDKDVTDNLDLIMKTMPPVIIIILGLLFIMKQI